MTMNENLTVTLGLNGWTVSDFDKAATWAMTLPGRVSDLEWNGARQRWEARVSFSLDADNGQGWLDDDEAERELVAYLDTYQVDQDPIGMILVQDAFYCERGSLKWSEHNEQVRADMAYEAHREASWI